ncbi:MAG: pseudouridine-5'-phosphate glycosidase [Acidimicrobiales bacterium]
MTLARLRGSGCSPRGIGGVHRGAELSGDVSHDLVALARHPVVTVSAGAKAFLDLARTLEFLETQGVPVVGWRTDRFPAFYTRDSGLALAATVRSGKRSRRWLVRPGRWGTRAVSSWRTRFRSPDELDPADRRGARDRARRGRGRGPRARRSRRWSSRPSPRPPRATVCPRTWPSPRTTPSWRPRSRSRSPDRPPRSAGSGAMTEGRDWTRTQFEACPDCGADPSQLADEVLGRALLAEMAAFGRVLASADPVAVRTRPGGDDAAASSWSALEYACHVRDLLPVMEDRIRRLQDDAAAELGWWDHEAACVDERYNEQVPVLVWEAATANARSFVATVGGIGEDEWSRGATRRPGEHFTVRGMVRFVLHEVIHHRGDAERALRAAGPSA